MVSILQGGGGGGARWGSHRTGTDRGGVDPELCGGHCICVECCRTMLLCCFCTHILAAAVASAGCVVTVQARGDHGRLAGVLPLPGLPHAGVVAWICFRRSVVQSLSHADTTESTPVSLLNATTRCLRIPWFISGSTPLESSLHSVYAVLGGIRMRPLSSSR